MEYGSFAAAVCTGATSAAARYPGESLRRRLTRSRFTRDGTLARRMACIHSSCRRSHARMPCASACMSQICKTIAAARRRSMSSRSYAASYSTGMGTVAVCRCYMIVHTRMASGHHFYGQEQSAEMVHHFHLHSPVQVITEE